MDDEQGPPNRRILRLPEVLSLIGMGRAWLYAEIAAGRFPAGVSLGARARGWTLESVQAWISARPACRTAFDVRRSDRVETRS